MIVLKNVSKYYGETLAVSDLSLHVAEGETCVLLGKSGCGKSTTLRMINNIIQPTSGEVYVAGRRTTEYANEDLRRKIGYAIQSVGLFPYMSVAKNIAIVPKLLKWDKKKIAARVEEMLDLVGLDAEIYLHKYPSELSGGEAQRVGVARALAADPPILLMDEPFGAVDPINRSRLQSEFLKIQQKLHKTVVFVTHDIEEAVRMGNKIAIMEKGVLQNYDTPENITQGSNASFVTGFLGNDYYLKLLLRYNVSDYMKQLDDTDTLDSDCAVSINATLQDALSMLISQGAQKAVVTRGDEICGVILLDQIINIINGQKKKL